MPMHLPSRADALNDFLPEIATLGEAERTVLRGFLGQIPTLDIDSVGRNALGNTQSFKRLRANGRCAGGKQRLPQRGNPGRVRPESIMRNNRPVPAKDAHWNSLD